MFNFYFQLSSIYKHKLVDNNSYINNNEAPVLKNKVISQQIHPPVPSNKPVLKSKSFDNFESKENLMSNNSAKSIILSKKSSPAYSSSKSISNKLSPTRSKSVPKLNRSASNEYNDLQNLVVEAQNHIELLQSDLDTKTNQCLQMQDIISKLTSKLEQFRVSFRLIFYSHLYLDREYFKCRKS